MGRPAYSSDKLDSKRRDICRVALGVFARDGLEGMSLRAIARDMGCTTPALYKYFDSKEGLLAELRIEGFGLMERALCDARLNARSPLDAMRDAMAAYLQFAFDYPRHFTLMYQLAPPPGGSGGEVRAARESAFAQARLIADGVVETGLTQQDANLLAHIMWAGCHGLASLHLAKQLDLGCDLAILTEPLLSHLTGIETP